MDGGHGTIGGLTSKLMNGLTWLHLSDWHQRGRDFDRTVVRDALVRDIRERVKIDPALAEVDFVIFSGDVAFAGKAEEFQAAKEQLFAPVLEVLGLPPQKLFIVPGNHDLSDQRVKKFLPPDLQKPLENEEQVQNWLTDEESREVALGPFKDFASFVTGYTGQKPAAYANAWTGFIGSGSKTVGILCLNSAWMCGRNLDAKGKINDQSFLALGEPQLLAACRTLQKAILYK